MRLRPGPILLSATLALAACGGQSGTTNSSIAPVDGSITPQSASAVISNLKVPISVSQFVPCANAGNGEIVTLSGNLHVITKVTTTANNVHIMFTNNPQGVTGVGSVTGEKYQGTGVTRETENVPLTGSFPLNVTTVNNFRIIGRGPGNNLLIHSNSHITVNANGTVTVNKTNSTVACK